MDRLLFSLDGEEQEQELSLEQKFELVLNLVEERRASMQGSEEASTGLIGDATHDVVAGDDVGEKVEGPPMPAHPNPLPLEPTNNPLSSLVSVRRVGTIGLGDKQGISPAMRGRLGGDLGGSLALKRDILACLRGEGGSQQAATSPCPALLSQLQTEALEEDEEITEEKKEEVEERRFALLSLAIKEDRMSLLERVASLILNVRKGTFTFV